MSDPIPNVDRADDPQDRNSAAANVDANESAPPEFGLVDAIEAFTAMRHECRAQTRESRELAKSIQTAVANICQLDAKLTQELSLATQDHVARHLAEVVIEMDIHLTRAVDATVNYDGNHRQLGAEAGKAVREAYDQMNFVSRWFCRRFLTRSLQILDVGAEANGQENAATQGLTLVVSRLRRMMNERQIVRVETVGQPFDPETMNAIAAVPSNSQPSGHVIDELSPAYFWRGTLLRFAEVHVAS